MWKAVVIAQPAGSHCHPARHDSGGAGTRRRGVERSILSIPCKKVEQFRSNQQRERQHIRTVFRVWK